MIIKSVNYFIPNFSSNYFSINLLKHFLPFIETDSFDFDYDFCLSQYYYFLAPTTPIIAIAIKISSFD